jgi:hypothetical protein
MSASMSKLIEFMRPEPGAPARMITPEELIRMAEKLGRLYVEPESWSSRCYKAQIRFQNSSGSMIWATGTDTDFFGAIAKAIQEAGRLQ